MRGGDIRRFLDTWQLHTVATPAGELAYTVFPGPVPFVGCTKLNDTPIAPTDGRRLLAELGREHAGPRFMGDGSITVSPRVPI